MIRKHTIRSLALAASLACLAPSGAQASSETCREWYREHEQWRARVVGLALADAPQRAIDEALFELVQREAYLTSCPARVDAQRPHLVGWRLVGLAPPEYAGAVIESVLEEGGFDLDMRRRFAPLRTARRTR
ncbi:MAG: hypothetical protein ACQGVC_09725 [Myxococcota bacterium]